MKEKLMEVLNVSESAVSIMEGKTGASGPKGIDKALNKRLREFFFKFFREVFASSRKFFEGF